MTTSFHPVYVGILGTADIVRRKFMPALTATPSAQLTVLGSRDPVKAQTYLPEIEYQTRSYEQVLTSPDVDLVYIALPNDLHETWTIRALEAGKHVICEKPLGLDLASVRRMTGAARKTGSLLYENIMYLHHPQHRLVREMVQSGAIGVIRQLRANFCFTHTRPNDFRLNPAQGGGSFHDQARYPLTAALYHLQGALGEFHGVTRYRNGLDLAVTGSAISSTNELFTFTIAFDQPYEAFYEIIGERGTIHLDRAYTTPPELENTIRIMSGDRDETLTVPAADHFRLMLEHVCNQIKTGDDFATELRQIEQRAELIEQIFLGCRGKRHE